MARKNSSYSLSISIDADEKDIPYGGSGDVREDGHANHGFKNLKQNPGLINEVPEPRDEPILFELIKAINRPECGLFTIGSARWTLHDDQGYRLTGYVELAFNSIEMVEDASRYFPLFFHYDRHLEEIGFDAPIEIEWYCLAPASSMQA